MIEAVLGFDSPSSSLTEEVLETAKSICRSGALENESRNINPDIPCDLPDLQFSKFYHEKVDRTSALYYRLIVEDVHTDDGFVIYCESQNKDNFKVVIFDQNGALLEMEQSIKSRDGKSTQCVIHFNTCKTFEIPEYIPSNKDKDPVNHTLAKLNKIKPSTKAIATGNYLVFVYGCNLFGKSSFRLIVLPFNRGSPFIDSVLAIDEGVLDMKGKVEEIKTEYLAAKKAFYAARDKVIAIDKDIESSLTAKDLAYHQMIESSMDVCDPDPRQAPMLSPRRKQASSGLSFPIMSRFDRSGGPTTTTTTATPATLNGNPSSGSAFSSTIDADSSPVHVTNADTEPVKSNTTIGASASGTSGAKSVSFGSMSSSASVAGGWFSKTISSGLTQLQTMRQAATTPKKESQSVPSRAPTGLSIPSFFSSSSSSSTNANNINEPNINTNTAVDTASGEKVGGLGDFNSEAHTLLDTLATTRSPEAAKDTVMEKMRADGENSARRRENLHSIYSYDTPTKGSAGDQINEFDSEAANILKSIVPTPMSNDESISPDNTGVSSDAHWKTIPTTSRVDNQREDGGQDGELDEVSHNMTHLSIASMATPVSALSAATKPVAMITPSVIPLSTQIEPMSPDDIDTPAAVHESKEVTGNVDTFKSPSDQAPSTVVETSATATGTDATKKSKKKKKASGATTGTSSAPAFDGDDYLPEI